MSGASPWSVKGIAAEERELAKQAARRAGVPIGQWLSRQIRDAAEQERSAGRMPPRSAAAPEPPPPAAPTTTAAAWRSALAKPPLPSSQSLSSQSLTNPPPNAYQDPPPAPPMSPGVAPGLPAVPRAAPPSIDPARLRDLERRMDEVKELDARLLGLQKSERRVLALAAELNELSARVEAVEQRAEARMASLARDLADLGESVEALRDRPAASGDPAVHVAASTAPVERAVMRLAERLQRVEELTLPDERGRRGLLGRLFRR